MIYVIIVTIAVLAYLVYEYIVIKRILDDSDNRIMAMLNKAIDNVNAFFIGIFVGLWNWGDSDDNDDEIND